MKKEDIEFLRELQHELNTQETDGQAQPRYWGIAETKCKPTPEYCGDPYIFLGEGKPLTCKEFVDFLTDNDYLEGHEEEWEEVDKEDTGNLVSFATYNLQMRSVREVWMDTEYHIISEDSNVFLTKRACQAHIKANGYHYSKPHTYAMTAWRNPEFERVLNILQTMNLDDIKVTEE